MVEGLHSILLGPFIWRNIKIELLCAVLVAVIVIITTSLVAWFIDQGLDVDRRSRVGYSRTIGHLRYGIIGIGVCLSASVYKIFHMEDIKYSLDWMFAGLAPLIAIIISMYFI